MDILWFLSGFAVGGVVLWLVAHYRYKSVGRREDTALEVYQQRIKDLSEELDHQKEEVKRERNKVITLSNRLAASQSEFKHMEQRLTEQRKEIDSIQEKFYSEFKNLANQIFEEKSKKFTDQNKVNLESILKPLGDKINDFEKRVERNSKESLEWHAALKEQIHGLKELNVQITKEAENLTKALKGDSKTMGNWGEVILESILEKSGLKKDREYVVQKRYKTDDGRRIQPDVIIKLPDGKNIIIDSKVSLTAYERYVNETEDREMHLRDHLHSVRNHLKSLDVKSYQKLYDIKGLDFVLMFVPIEPAFSAAVQHDPRLFNDAYDKNVVMVSPATLIATLRTIANIWRNEYQNQNALEIARQGGALYDKFVAFADDLKSIGKHMDTTRKVYTDAMGKLASGRGNLMSRAEKIRELGVKTSKKNGSDASEGRGGVDSLYLHFRTDCIDIHG